MLKQVLIDLESEEHEFLDLWAFFENRVSDAEVEVSKKAGKGGGRPGRTSRKKLLEQAAREKVAEKRAELASIIDELGPLPSPKDEAGWLTYATKVFKLRQQRKQSK